MKSAILVLMVVLPIQLTTTKGFIDCRTACRKCREGFDEVSILEVYCSMCKECRDRRRERSGQQRLQSQNPGFSKFPQSFQTRTFYRDVRTPRIGRMDMDWKGRLETREKTNERNIEMEFAKKEMLSELKIMRKEKQQKMVLETLARGLYVPTRRSKVWTRPIKKVARTARVGDDEEYMATWPEHCPTPPVCSSEEEVVKLTNPHTITTTTTTTITTTTTTTTEPPTCPPIDMCRKKKKTTPVTTCIPCMPMCPAPCPPQVPLIPSAIELNINWKGDFPFNFNKRARSTTEMPSDWIENPNPDEVTVEVTHPPTMVTHTTPTTMTVPTTPLAPVIPLTVPNLPTMCPPQPNPANWNPCCLPVSLQGHLSYLGINCDPRQIETTSSTANDLQKQIILNEELIRKILINGNLNNNGGNNANEIMNGNNNGGSLNGIYSEDSNNNDSPNINGGLNYNGNNNVNHNVNHNFNQNLNSNTNSNGNQNNNAGSHNGISSGDSNNNSNRNINGGLNINGNNNVNHNINQNLNSNATSNGNRNKETDSFNGNNAGPNLEYPSSGGYNHNKKGGPSNIEYDIQKKLVINENPYNDRDLHRKIVINDRNNDLHRQIVIKEDPNKIEILPKKHFDNDNQGASDHISKTPDCDKKKTTNPDQDYYYVYVGLPKNLAPGSRRAAAVDFSALNFQIPQSGLF